MSTLVVWPPLSFTPIPGVAFCPDSQPEAGENEMTPQPQPAETRLRGENPVLITGGAGFIGCNLADRFLARGRRVRVFDNLSRPGVEQNLDWLRIRHGDRVEFRLGDIRDAPAVENAVRGCGAIFHLAARGAVRAGLSEPGEEFDINARGTIHLLEAVRRSPRRHPLIYASTSKVYGPLEEIALGVDGTRYKPMDPDLCHGFAEDRPVCLQPPCDCTQSAAEQHLLDHARDFGLPAVALRLSCIYGPRQIGGEDQGWITHFVRQSIAGLSVRIFGDGRQVRDALHVDDLVDALSLAVERIERIAGRAFNIGGGPDRTTSPLELLEIIQRLNGEPPSVRFAPWRAGDPRYYVSDIRRFGSATGWSPRVNLEAGIARLHRWIKAHLPPPGLDAPCILSVSATHGQAHPANIRVLP